MTTDQQRIHQLFVSDAVNDEMDRMLQMEASGFWRRFFRKFVG